MVFILSGRRFRVLKFLFFLFVGCYYEVKLEYFVVGEEGGVGILYFRVCI